MATMKFNPVGWFEIYVNDMDRAVRFYEQVLGYKLEPLPAPKGVPVEMMAFPGEMNQGGATGTLIKMENCPPGHGGPIIYFATEDCAIPEAKVAEYGGKVCQAKMSLSEYGYCSIVTDSEGNTIGFHSMK